MDQREHRDELHEAEMRAMQKLGPNLKEHTELALAAFNLIGEMLARLPEEVFAARRQSLKVANGLLARLANDMRCVALLANRGYPIQAGALGASIYEIAFTIASIGSDDRLAQQWIDHDNPTKTFEDPWTLTRDGLRKLEIPDADSQTAIEYRIYSQLCMNKHASPLLQKEHSYRIQDGAIATLLGPDDTEEAIRPAQFALEHAVHLASLAMLSFVQEHLASRISKKLGEELLAKVDSLAASRKALEIKSKTRWGTEDPFRGKWRGLPLTE